jgi:hypothetical protein
VKVNKVITKLKIGSIGKVGVLVLAIVMIAVVSVQAACKECQSKYQTIYNNGNTFLCDDVPGCTYVSKTSSCYYDSWWVTVNCFWVEVGYGTTIQVRPCHSDDGCNP